MVIDTRTQTIAIGSQYAQMALFNLSHTLVSQLLSQVSQVSDLVENPTANGLWSTQPVYYLPVWRLQLLAQKIGYDDPQLGHLFDAILSYFINAPVPALRFTVPDTSLAILITAT